MSALFHIVDHEIPGQYVREYPRAVANQQEDVLRLSVKQYIPRSNPEPRPGDVTIIGAHANGFAKELYEPLWEDLLERAEKQGWRIRSIWIADVVQQGASSVLNENLLGNDPSWLDHSRDLLHLINVKRAEMPRPLIGIGHSMGGAQLLNLSLLHPRLLSTLVLLDPVIEVIPDGPNSSRPQSYGIAALSSYRRSLWPSREAAAESFQRSPFYQKWDTRVLDRWIKHGLREAPTTLYPDAKSPQVTLTTPVSHEVHTFLRPNYGGSGTNGKPLDRRAFPDLDTRSHRVTPFYRPESAAIGHRLPEVRPSVLWVFGETSEVGDPVSNPTKVARTGIGQGGSGGVPAGRVKGITFQGIGHLIPMEVVEQTADVIADFVGADMERWRDEQREYEEWTKNSLQDKQGLDDEWMNHMAKLRGRQPKASKM